MVKGILGVVAGFAAWMIVATLAGLVIRLTWPAYVSVAAAMTFTLAMMIARLSIGAVATVLMGLVAAAIARSTTVAVWAGGLMLIFFVPEHVRLWHTFPVWYHLTFLVSLVPLAYWGGTIAARFRR